MLFGIFIILSLKKSVSNLNYVKKFYSRSKMPKYMVTESKILYVYTRVPISEGQDMMMLDKYGLEWKMLLPNEVKYLTYL